ncbi:hypothetical protein DF186_16000, partial [Enterococcus hirae]
MTAAGGLAPFPRKRGFLAAAFIALLLAGFAMSATLPRFLGTADDIYALAPSELRDTVAVMPFTGNGERFLAAGLSDDLEIR